MYLFTKRLIKIFIFYFILFDKSLAEEILLSKHKTNLPLEIRADNLSIDIKKNQIFFEGNSQASQGDLKIRSGKINANFVDNSEKKRKINNIKFSDKVVINSSSIIKGDEACLDLINSKLTITGNVIIYMDKNEIKGQKLIYNLAAGSVKIFGNNNDRAKIIINIE